MRSTDILIVDDELGIREVLQETLEDEGYTVALAENAEAARRLRNQNRPAMVLLDIWMPDSDGITLLKEWATNGQLTMPVVMMSGHGSIDTAVEATKIGALDFLEKPIPLQKLLATVERALKYSESQNRQNISLDYLGSSAIIKELVSQIEHARNQNGTILLLGEAGCPFDTVARSFHRKDTPWVQPGKPEHISEMPIELLNKAGNGILYLGDIALMDANIRQQIAFLLDKAQRHNARVICTSSQPLNEILQIGQESKLSAILSSLVVELPPLRHQAEDIPFLVNQIAADLSKTQKTPNTRFTASAMAKLRQYEWPGNLEQLRNVVHSLIMNAEHGEINDGAVMRVLSQFEHNDLQDIKSIFNFNLPLRELREELERRYFQYHIRQENNNMSRVAQKVGLERTHLYRKLKQLGITFARRGEKE